MVSIRYQDVSGRYVRETLGTVDEGWTRAKAKKLRAQRSHEARNGHRTPEAVGFRMVADRWFEEESRRRAWKPRTLMAYKRSLERLKFFHGYSCRDLRPSHVARWVEENRYAPKTVNDDISVLQAVLGYAQRHELVESNAAANAPRPKLRKKSWRILEPSEVQKVDGCFDDEKARMIFRVLTRTAIRRDELRNLRVRNLDLKHRSLRIVEGKTEESARVIALSPRLASQLEDWLSGLGRHHPDDYVFQSSRGNRVNYDWYKARFQVACQRAGITDYIRPFHDMRHTSLTNEAATGQSNPLALMAKAGHRSMNTTQQYIKLAGMLFHDQAEALERRLSGE